VILCKAKLIDLFFYKGDDNLNSRKSTLKKQTSRPFPRIILIWALGIVLICGLLRFGPAHAFIPDHAEESIEDGSDTGKETSASEANGSSKSKKSGTAADDKKTDKTEESTNSDDTKRDSEDEDSAAKDDEKKEQKASVLQILLICLAMTGMLALALLLWGELSIKTAAYVAAFYVIVALPMLRGPIFAFAIMLDHAAWMFWVFRMPRLRRQIPSVTTYEYVEIALNSFLLVSGFCLVYYLGGVDNLEFVTYIRPSIYVVALLAVAHVLFLIRLFRRNANVTSRLLMIGAFFFCFACILNRQDVYFAAGLTLILAFLFYYLVTDNPEMLDFMERMGNERAALRGYKARFIAILILAGFVAAYFAAASIA